MDVFVLVPYAGEELTMEVYNLDPARSIAAAQALDEMPRFGEYMTEVEVPDDLATGNYYVRIFNDQGVNRKIGYMRIVSNTEYHFVNDFGDFNREITTQDIEDQLEDEFIQPPPFEVN